MKILKTLTICSILLAAGPVLASQWGGHNGTVYLSIDSAESIVSTATSPAKGDMGVLVDVSAVLTDLDPLLHDGERVMAVGGFEIKLGIEGVQDARIVNKDITVKHLDMSEDPAGCVAGLFPDLELKDGSAVLVTWKVLIPGPVRPVKFYIDASGVQSCAGLEGCADSGTCVLWSGSVQARQHGLLFSAGYVPAYLNWEGEADLSPVRGTTDWEDTGLFTLGTVVE